MEFFKIFIETIVPLATNDLDLHASLTWMCSIILSCLTTFLALYLLISDDAEILSRSYIRTLVVITLLGLVLCVVPLFLKLKLDVILYSSLHCTFTGLSCYQLLGDYRRVFRK